MPTSSLRVPAAAPHARLARLVVGAAARRSGVDPEALDDVRLAVGEALAQAAARTSEEVAITMTDTGEYFEVSLTDGQPIDRDDEVSALSVAVIRAIVPKARIMGADTLTMRWETQA